MQHNTTSFTKWQIIVAAQSLLVLFLILSGSVAFAEDTPNIVYLLVDNWGWGDISVQGGTIHT
ncbi:MAG: hypothetical protein GY801_44480, partial [bacterium]|nr:hypothetical protein [bacterium]